MKLYYVPQTRSTRPRWVLEELGVPYELVRLDVEQKQHKSESYLKIHPLGHVPALVDGEQTIIESAAIALYLADKYPEKKLAPAPTSPERGAYYQWVLFATATLEPPLADIFANLKQPGELNAAKAERARARWNEVATALQTKIAGRPFLVGDHFTVADLIVAAMLGWAKAMKLLGGFPGLEAYANPHLARPAAKKARAD